MTHYKLAVSDQACLVSHIITFFQVIDQLAGEAGALITMRHSFAFDTIFYPAFTTVFGFAHIADQAAGTGIFMKAMPVADLAVHSTGSK